jgi:peptide chain release factor 3
MTTLPDEIARRRTFAIISHPDAGKTTLTEKLLLFGGAIQLAGEVQGARRAAARPLRLDGDRARARHLGVVGGDDFEHDGLAFNLLDTPGHQDFSEDTYRTLTAVDSAVMVLDAARGIEEQTRKLFEVCRLRDVPIITFVNKLDREARDPFDLIDEIEQTLALDVTPASWPIGMGRDFLGTYDLFARYAAAVRSRARERRTVEPIRCSGLDDPQLPKLLPEAAIAGCASRSRWRAASARPSTSKSFREGHLTPVFLRQRAQQFRRARAVARGRRPGAVAAPAAGRTPRAASDRAGGRSRVRLRLQGAGEYRPAAPRPHRLCPLCSGRFQRGMKLKNVRTGR